MGAIGRPCRSGWRVLHRQPVRRGEPLDDPLSGSPLGAAHPRLQFPGTAHPAAGGRAILGSRSRTASALSMSRREMLGERQVAAPLMTQRTAHGALRLAHRRFQPGEGVGIQLAGFRLGGKPQRPSPCQLGHETLVLAFALFAPAASRPGQHRAVQRQRGRQVAPCGHASKVRQRFLRLVPRDAGRSAGVRSPQTRTSRPRRRHEGARRLVSRSPSSPPARIGPAGWPNLPVPASRYALRQCGRWRAGLASADGGCAGERAGDCGYRAITPGCHGRPAGRTGRSRR